MVSEGLTEIEFAAGNAKFVIRRKSELKPCPPVCSESKQEEVLGDTLSITSPLSGVFYASQKPGMPPFAKNGDMVNKGDTFCIIEAMKVMNEIKFDAKYKIIKIFAVNGKPVSAGEVLCLVKPL